VASKRGSAVPESVDHRGQAHHWPLHGQPARRAAGGYAPNRWPEIVDERGRKVSRDKGIKPGKVYYLLPDANQQPVYVWTADLFVWLRQLSIALRARSQADDRVPHVSEIRKEVS
jgi:hypothetical protein